MTKLHETVETAHRDRKEEFPNSDSDDHKLRLANIEKCLYDEVHQLVGLFAAIAESGVLTDHGPNHIKTVIRRAGELATAVEAELTGYEAYLLILAIHFHDVGNLLGRDQHEKKILEVMSLLGEKIGTDNIEKRLIGTIARAHGGFCEDDPGSKDTIGTVPNETEFRGVRCRQQLLAALVRFADEMAEEKSRANVPYLLLSEYAKNNETTPVLAVNLPPESEVYQKVATLLYPPDIKADGSEIKITYEIVTPDLCRQFRKGTKQVYLFDEVQERIVKTHLEHEYFSQFTRRFRLRTIEQLTAEITICAGTNHVQPVETFRYTFRRQGFPEAKAECSAYLAARETTGKGATGKDLKRRYSPVKKQRNAAG